MGKKSNKHRLAKSSKPIIANDIAKVALVCGSTALVLAIMSIPGINVRILPSVNFESWFTVIIALLLAVIGLHITPKEELRGNSKYIRMAKMGRLFSKITLGIYIVTLAVFVIGILLLIIIY